MSQTQIRLIYSRAFWLIVVTVVWFLVLRRGKFFVRKQSKKTFSPYRTKQTYLPDASDSPDQKSLKREMQQLQHKEKLALQKLRFWETQIPSSKNSISLSSGLKD